MILISLEVVIYSGGQITCLASSLPLRTCSASTWNSSSQPFSTSQRWRPTHPKNLYPLPKLYITLVTPNKRVVSLKPCPEKAVSPALTLTEFLCNPLAQLSFLPSSPAQGARCLDSQGRSRPADSIVHSVIGSWASHSELFSAFDECGFLEGSPAAKGSFSDKG